MRALGHADRPTERHYVLLISDTRPLAWFMAHQLMYHVYAMLIWTISAPPSKLSPPLSYKQLANNTPPRLTSTRLGQ